MCGIAGAFLKYPKISLNTWTDSAADTLRHRGPDDIGKYYDTDLPLSLAHTRLSILDTSPSGHQPMTSSDNRITIVFNGEIYNYKELRKELID